MINANRFAEAALCTLLPIFTSQSVCLAVTPENTYYLLGNDPASASSITGVGTPVGWTNAFGSVATKVVAGGNYVVDGKFTPEGAIGSLRTDGESCRFGGASLTLNNGSQLSVQGSEVIVPRLYVREGEGLVTPARSSGMQCSGNWEVFSGGRLVFNRRNANDSRAISVNANISGSGEIVVANGSNATGYLTFLGDNSGLTGSVVLESDRDNVEIRWGGSSWPGNPSEPAAAVVNLRRRKCTFLFKESMTLDTPNRVVDFGNCRSTFSSNPTEEGTRVTIASPLRGTQGLVLS